MAGYVIRHQYVLLPGIVCSAFDNVLLPGIVCSVFDRTLLPGFIQLGYLQSTFGLHTARVSTVYFRASYSSGIYSLLPGFIQLGYLQSTSGPDTARVICTLLSGLIQLDVCYFAERYDQCSVAVLVIDGWTSVKVVTLNITPPPHLPCDFIIYSWTTSSAC
ncbi:hypothetical protein DPMN_016764 [Dreissena polymorpha]|uniref:Uncharacterized protein n=1 Tax=Dreissena polymorpha TaxID=45954 RepID=A0A9D4NDG9_DREPO|nr:hypothetical protein DPMN_016764 [Dreissena polymorpha]